MTRTVEAVFEDGVLRPLERLGLVDGQRLTITIRTAPTALRDAEEEVRRWGEVYEGLSEADIQEIEAIILDRSNFSSYSVDDEEV